MICFYYRNIILISINTKTGTDSDKKVPQNIEAILFINSIKMKNFRFCLFCGTCLMHELQFIGLIYFVVINFFFLV